MSSKRILLVHDDRLLTNLYRLKLEGNGFSVDSTRNLDQVPKLIEAKKPDLLIIDIILSTGDGIELIKSLRVNPATLEMPVLVLSTPLAQLEMEALKAGATKVIGRGKQTVASVIDAAKTELGLPGLGESAKLPLFHPDDEWVTTVAEQTTDAINQMRHCLPGIAASPPDAKALRSLWAHVHSFAEKSGLIQQALSSHLASTFDLLMCDLNQMPEQLNASTLRTIGQAIDFLNTLNNPEIAAKLKDPASARIVVVDDEESAIQMIAAAMQLAGLKCDNFQTPTTAMEALNDKPCDLILLDVGLPEMTGFELCNKIRTLEVHQKTPVVFLTGLNTFHNKAQASLSGGNDFVGKPFNLPELGLKALLWILRGQAGLL